jgi:PIN domain nuclease of toxin-antitoxin system
MLAAQALDERLALVTRDRAFRPYGVRLLRA